MPPTTDDTASGPGGATLDHRPRAGRPAPDVGPRLVGLGDIARMCNKSYSWAKRMRARGQLPVPHIERRDSLGRYDRVEWLLVDVDEWIALGMPSGDAFSRERRKARR